MKRLLFWTGIFFAVITLTVGLLLVTETGNHWLIRFALARFAPDVTVETLRGTVFDELSAEGVRYRPENRTLDIDRVTLRFEPLALLGGRLVVHNLQAGRVSLVEEPAGGESSPPGDIFLPVAVSVDRARVAGFSLQVGETEVLLENVQVHTLTAQRRLRFALLGFDLAAVHAEITGSLGLEARLPAEFDFRWSLQDGTAEGAGTAHGDRDALDVDHTLDRPVVVTTEGRLGLSDDMHLDARSTMADIEWSLPDLGPVRITGGTVVVDGTLESAAVTGSADIVFARGTVRAELGGRTTTRQLDIQRLQLTHAETVVTTGGEVVFRPELAWSLDVTGQHVDPAMLWPEWPGDLSVTAGIDGGRRDDGVHWAVSDARVDGTLREHAIDMTGGIDGEPQQLRLNGLLATLGDNRVTLDGTVAAELDLEFRLDANDLNAVHAQFGGEISGDGRLQGPRERPALEAQLTGNALAWRDYAVSSLDVNARLGSEATDPFELDVTAREVTTPFVGIAGLSVATRGTPAAHEIIVHSNREAMQATLSARGGLDGRRWEGDIRQLELTAAQGVAWQLRESAPLAVAPGTVRLESLCLVRDSTRLCGALNVAGGDLDSAHVTADGFDLNQLQPWLPEALSAAGPYRGQVRFERTPQGPVADLEIHGGDTRVSLQREGGQLLSLSVATVDATGSFNREAANLDIKVRGEAESRMDIAFAAVEPTSPDADISGRIDIDWNELSLISALIPEVDMSRANLQADARISGTRDAPRVRGTALLHDGRVVYTPLGIALENVELTARSQTESLLSIEGTAVAGADVLEVSGEIQMRPDANWPARLDITGAATPLIRLPEAQVSVAPDLDVDIEWPEVRATGKLAIPSASLVLRELPADAKRPLPETVVHDENGNGRRHEEERLALYADLELVLGDDVRYRALGLEGTVSGSLELEDKPQQSPQASGTLLLNGRYAFYGQELTIENGKLLFAGPLDDPVLDVRATRKVGDVTAGVRLSGSATAPNTELFSEPALSESDTLSYVLFGRPLSTAGDEVGTMNNAALALGVISALPVSSRAQSSLGLDELRLDTGTYDTSSIMAGKQITPDLYIRYTYGLFNSLGGLSVLYKFNERLGTEARSAEHQSIDLTYTVTPD